MIPVTLFFFIQIKALYIRIYLWSKSSDYFSENTNIAYNFIVIEQKIFYIQMLMKFENVLFKFKPSFVKILN